MEAGVGIEPAYVELQSTAWPLCHPALKPFNLVPIPVRGEDGEEWQTGAGNETRTRDPDLGKVVLYQLSYSRINQNVATYSYPFLVFKEAASRAVHSTYLR